MDRNRKNSHKGLDYLELSQFDCNIKMYLNFIMNDKSVLQMLKIRTANHTLAVETDRHGHRRDYEDRICNLCNTDDVQDLFHVIVKCPALTVERTQLILSNNILPDSITKTELYHKLNKISRKEIKAVTQFMEIIEEKKIFNVKNSEVI